MVVGSTGVLKGLFQLIQKHPGVTWAWMQLMKPGNAPMAITSSLELPTLWDLVILLIWAKSNPSIKKVWQHVGQLLWPTVMWLCGSILDTLALDRSKRPLEQLPLLKTLKGKSKRVQFMADIAMPFDVNSSKAGQITGQSFATYLQKPTGN